MKVLGDYLNRGGGESFTELEASLCKYRSRRYELNSLIVVIQELIKACQRAKAFGYQYFSSMIPEPQVDGMVIELWVHVEDDRFIPDAERIACSVSGPDGIAAHALAHDFDVVDNYLCAGGAGYLLSWGGCGSGRKSTAGQSAALWVNSGGSRSPRYSLRVDWEEGFTAPNGNVICERCIDSIVVDGVDALSFDRAKRPEEEIELVTSCDLASGRRGTQ